MSDVEMAEVDPMLADEGRCWSCKQPFEGDEFYFRIGRGSRLAPAIATCTGCTCLMLFDPR
jgi:hypothetical protein